ncbi:hypothetical protein EMPS_03822 [Entomortierella parvispora]|uniref:Uncharacterized protein n=1 Tax=Entomortierella parvispora TaxID=205924 RepID=A0A9P3H7I2_9FUNG|nr:hypothetical protein EMPS_03822 [Entomortierella parvispora]
MVGATHQKAFPAGANDHRHPFSESKTDMIRPESALAVIMPALTQQCLITKMSEKSALGNSVAGTQSGPEQHQRFDTQPPTVPVHAAKSHEQPSDRSGNSPMQRDMLGSFGDRPQYSVSGNQSPPASPRNPPRYLNIKRHYWIPYEYIIIPSLMPTYTGRSQVRIVAVCQAEFRPMDSLVFSHILASTAYEIADPASFLLQHESSLFAASSVLHHVFVTATNYSCNSDKSPETWNGLWKTKGGDMSNIHLLTEERPFISICLNRPAEILGMREVLKNAKNPLLDDGLTSGLTVVDHWSRETIWQCDGCSSLAPQNQSLADGHQVTLADYGQLCQRKTEHRVRLSNVDAMHHLTKTLESSPSASKIYLDINTPKFFNPDAMGGLIQEITELFVRLATAILIQSPLLELKIAAETLPRYEDSFRLMNAIFNCPSLRELTLVDTPLMLQQPDLPMIFPDLRLLSLDNVYVETEAAAKNFVHMIRNVKGLEVLHMNRMRFTRNALAVDMQDAHLSALSQCFRNLKELSLVENVFLTCDQLLDFVAMVLAVNVGNRRDSILMMNKGTSKLKRLDLSDNPRMEGAGWDSFFKRFEARRKALVYMDARIQEQMKRF